MLAINSLMGAAFCTKALAPAFIAARTYSSFSLKLRTTRAVCCEIDRTHVMMSRPLPSGRLISTIIRSGLIFAI
jgi:hypothetical protein